MGEGVHQELLKMVVPNEIVRHLIGKGGANINKLQRESGARIQVEPEASMFPGNVGRTVNIHGTMACRCMAQYLISRQIVEDRNVKAEWLGGYPFHDNHGQENPNKAEEAALPALVVVVP